MFLEGKKVVVRVSRCKLKLDTEAEKWATVGLTLRLKDDPDSLTPALRVAVKAMERKELDRISLSETVENCKLTFSSAADLPKESSDSTRTFSGVELADFLLEREEVTQSGTLTKKASGALSLQFGFTVPLKAAGSWLLSSFGSDVALKVEQLQRELPLDEKAKNIEGALQQDLATEAEKSGAGKKRKKA